MKKLLLLLSIFFLSFITYADSNLIKITVPGHGIKNAIFSPPVGDKKYPAIVFMHGGSIRDKGVPVSSLNKRISSFTSLGFIVLAPVRSTKKRLL